MEKNAEVKSVVLVSMDDYLDTRFSKSKLFNHIFSSDINSSTKEFDNCVEIATSLDLEDFAIRDNDDIKNMKIIILVLNKNNVTVIMYEDDFIRVEHEDFVSFDKTISEYMKCFEEVTV